LNTQTLVATENFGGSYKNYIDLVRKSRGAIKNIEIKEEEPLKSELKHFIECIIDQKKPEVDIDDGYETIKIVERIKKSKGKKIKI